MATPTVTNNEPNYTIASNYSNRRKKNNESVKPQTPEKEKNGTSTSIIQILD